MPKLDKQNRLQVPMDLWKAGLNSERKVAFVLVSGKIQISPRYKTKNAKVIGFRTMDAKGRVTIPKEVSEILQYDNREEILVVYLEGGKIFIEKL